MTGARTAAMLLAALLWFGVATSAGQSGPRPVTLYIPAFASEATLGLRAATLVNLQIWQTLRKAPFPNPDNRSFGDGLIVWDPSPLSDQTHEGAARQARAAGADLVLWGKAWRYGGGVAVQLYLTLLDPSPERAPRWTASAAPPGGAPLSLTMGLPRLRYEFAPVVLDGGVVESLTSPSGLPIVGFKGSTAVKGAVGSDFRAIEHDGAWTHVQSGAIDGWVHLPQLSQRRSEVVDFVGALIRMQRTDWAGAVQLLERVRSTSGAAHAVRADADLLMALANAKLGRDPLPSIRRAYEMNPHDVVTTKYECMYHVARLASTTSSASLDDTRRRLADILSDRRYLYSAQDPWFAKVRALVGSVGRP